MVIRTTFLALAALVGIVAGCAGPAGPTCESDGDCDPGEICLSSGGVFFGSSYCAPLGDPTDIVPDAGNNVSANNCAPEAACDGVDDDGDNIVDEGCPCNFDDSSEGVCANSTISCAGACIEPDGYETDETSCDGVDNDCDGDVDEGMNFQGTSPAAGREHTCALDAEGSAYCWGRNADGQLGNGSFDNSPVPVAVDTTLTFTKVSAGAFHTCGIADDMAIHCWGRNDNNQVDTSDEPTINSPVSIAPPVGAWSDVSAGANFTCGISSGVVYCWGNNDSAQLGSPPGDETPGPNPITLPDGDTSTFRTVSAGGSHACAATDTDRVYCWGINDDGQLGSSPDQLPEPISLGNRYTLQDVTAGANHTCVFGEEDDGTGIITPYMGCFGANSSQQLGTDMPTTGGASPVPVTSPAVGPMRAGTEFTCSFDPDVGVACWGRNDLGQSGQLPENTGVGDLAVPDLIANLSIAQLPNRRTDDVTAGGSHACAATNEGIFCWGNNEFGQLGGSDAPPGTISAVSCVP